MFSYTTFSDEPTIIGFIQNNDSLLHGKETVALYYNQLKLLGRYNQRWLCNIIGIKWQGHVSGHVTGHVVLKCQHLHGHGNCQKTSLCRSFVSHENEILKLYAAESS